MIWSFQSPFFFHGMAFLACKCPTTGCRPGARPVPTPSSSHGPPKSSRLPSAMCHMRHTPLWRRAMHLNTTIPTDPGLSIECLVARRCPLFGAAGCMASHPSMCTRPPVCPLDHLSRQASRRPSAVIHARRTSAGCGARSHSTPTSLSARRPEGRFGQCAPRRPSAAPATAPVIQSARRGTPRSKAQGQNARHISRHAGTPHEPQRTP